MKRVTIDWFKDAPVGTAFYPITNNGDGYEYTATSGPEIIIDKKPNGSIDILSLDPWSSVDGKYYDNMPASFETIALFPEDSFKEYKEFIVLDIDDLTKLASLLLYAMVPNKRLLNGISEELPMKSLKVKHTDYTKPH